MYKKMNLFVIAITMLLIAAFTSCERNDVYEYIKPNVNTLNIKNYFIAGTYKSQLGRTPILYFIRFLENNKAVFIESQPIKGIDVKSRDYSLVGDYLLTEDSLIVIVNDSLNLRDARFALNDDMVTGMSYQKDGSKDYTTSSDLIEISETNQFAKKTFKGTVAGLLNYTYTEYYKFDAMGTMFGTGADTASITMNKTPEIINNSAYRISSAGATQLGYIDGDTLTVFRTGGYEYVYAKYNQQ